MSGPSRIPWGGGDRAHTRLHHGNVPVLQTDAVRVNSIWAEVEFPALNPNVTSRTAVNPETGIEVLLWSR